jgi:hypothetical protein
MEALQLKIGYMSLMATYATGASSMPQCRAMQMEISASGVRVPQQARSSTLLFIFWQNFPNEIGEAVQD